MPKFLEVTSKTAAKAALNVDHFIDPRDFGAVGDGVADDTEALQDSLDAAAAVGDSRGKVVYIVPGTYLISDTLLVGDGVSVIGHSPDYVTITTDLAITMMKVPGTGGDGNRYGQLQGFKLDGNDVATEGLHLGGQLGLVVQRRFQSLNIYDVDGYGLILDGTQNCHFDSVDFARCQTSIYVINGAGNNLFSRCEINESITAGVVIDNDSEFPGLSNPNTAGFVNPQANLFHKCITERGPADHQIWIKNGSRNVFFHLDVQLPSETGTHLVAIESSSALNKFESCFFSWSGTEGSFVPVRNAGFRNFFNDCEWSGNPSTTTVLSTSNQAVVTRPHLSNSGYVFTNTAGDRTLNLIYKPITNRVAIGESLDSAGQTGFHWCWDSNRNRVVWWDGYAWKAGDGGGLVTSTSTSSATPSINCDVTQQHNITGLATNVTGVTVTGTPADGQLLRVRITDNGTSRTITWGAQFVAGSAALLTATAPSKPMISEFRYNSALAVWVCEQSNQPTMLDAAGIPIVEGNRRSNAANYVQIYNNVSGSPPQINAAGSEANIDVEVNPKGSGRLRVAGVSVPTLTSNDFIENKTLVRPVIQLLHCPDNTFQVLQLGGPATASNYLQLNNAASGSTPTFYARGDVDADVGIDFFTKGTGVARVNSVPISTRLTGTATLDFGSVTAGSYAEQSITVTGAAVGDAVALGYPAVTDGIVYSAYVSATNTVKVVAHNHSASAVDPASGTFRATIIR